MIVVEEKNLLYLCPPKTGTVTLMIPLQHGMNGYWYDTKYSHHNTVWDEKFRTYYKFVTVRHPYRRMISLWQFVMDKIQKVIVLTPEEQQLPEHVDFMWWLEHLGDKPMSLSEFIQEPSIRKYMLKGVYSCFWHIQQMPVPIDKIVHLERFDEEIRQVPHLHDIEYRHKNSGPWLDKPWHEYYDDHTIYLVRNYWPHDFLPLGYNPNFREVVQGKIFA